MATDQHGGFGGHTPLGIVKGNAQQAVNSFDQSSESLVAQLHLNISSVLDYSSRTVKGDDT